MAFEMELSHWSFDEDTKRASITFEGGYTGLRSFLGTALVTCYGRTLADGSMYWEMDNGKVLELDTVNKLNYLHRQQCIKHGLIK